MKPFTFPRRYQSWLAGRFAVDRDAVPSGCLQRSPTHLPAATAPIKPPTRGQPEE